MNQLQSILDFIDQCGGNVIDEPKHFMDRSAVYQLVKNLHPKLIEWLNNNLPDGLYKHQAKAIDLSLSDIHTVIATGTASGKTLAFAIPVFQRLLMDSKARALFFYPTKALAGDQLQKLQSLANSLGLGDVVFRFDGDVKGQARRHDVLSRGRLLLCTPDVLHSTMLRENLKAPFNELFNHLCMVVLDECHIYSGAFGSNMAFLLRRLRQVCRNHGQDPIFMAASATSSQPTNHMKNLTGLEFLLVDSQDDGSPSGGRTFIMVDPGGNDSLPIDLIAKITNLKRRFIMFCHSRRLTEQGYDDLISKYKDLDGIVMPYRSGYEAEDRQRIEASYREGELAGVISTSALELGVDLPDLDVCILAGLPSTAMSFWQRAGRVGRNPNKPGFILIIPGQNPLDEYFRIHPDRFYNRDLEELVIRLDNWPLIISHFACARAESGDFEVPRLDEDIFGSDFASLVHRVMDLNDDILFKSDPQLSFGLRGIGDPTYEIYLMGGAERLGTISWSQILREAYPGAVYRHMGQPYRVDKLRTKDLMVYVKAESRGITTYPTGYITVQRRREVYRCKRWSEHFELWHGTVTVVTKTEGYRERLGDKIIKQEKYHQPLQHRVISDGVWLKIGSEVKVTKGGLNALIHAISAVYAITNPCDPMDIATYSSVASSDGNSYIYIFDTASGGLGFTDKAFDNFETLLDLAEERLETCEHCDEEAYDKGCPACIQSFRWYEDNEHLSKKDALVIIDKIRQIMNQEVPLEHEFDNYKNRLAGMLTSIELAQQQSSALSEVAAAKETFGVRLFDIGVILQLKSGQKGEVLSRTIENNSVSYTIRFENGKELSIRDLNGNLNLISGSYSLLCLNCGFEGVNSNDGVCSVCGSKLEFNAPIG